MFVELLHWLLGWGRLNIDWVVYLFKVLHFNNVVMNCTECS
jgi:hypothetical protein